MKSTSGEIAGHLALALSRYLKESRLDGIAVPPELHVLTAFFIDCVRARQGAPDQAPCSHVGHDEVMDITTALLTKRETATALRCSLRTVDRLIAAGRLASVKVESATRIRRVDLDAYVAQLGVGSFRDQVERKASA